MSASAPDISGEGPNTCTHMTTPAVTTPAASAKGENGVSLLLACLRKIILLIPLIFILPHLLPDPVFGVFLAEPVSDILAATITTITFFARFDKILDRGAMKV